MHSPSFLQLSELVQCAAVVATQRPSFKSHPPKFLQPLLNAQASALSALHLVPSSAHCPAHIHWKALLAMLRLGWLTQAIFEVAVALKFASTISRTFTGVTVLDHFAAGSSEIANTFILGHTTVCLLRRLAVAIDAGAVPNLMTVVRVAAVVWVSGYTCPPSTSLHLPSIRHDRWPAQSVSSRATRMVLREANRRDRRIRISSSFGQSCHGCLKSGRSASLEVSFAPGSCEVSREEPQPDSKPCKSTR